MWSGADNAVPANWALCNGSNGTPNLMDKFIVGRGNSYGQGQTGGEATKTLGTANLPSHTHTDGTLAASGGSHSHNLSGVTGTSNHSHQIRATNGDDHNDTARHIQSGRNDSANFGYTNINTDNTNATFTLSGTTDPSGSLSLGVSGNTGDQGGTMGQSFEILPPYYAIAYIMRIS